VDKSAVSAAWGILALVLASAAVVVWQNALPQGWKFPAWSAWVMGISVVLAVYLCFASLFGLWPIKRKSEGRAGHEAARGDADGALQVMSGSPGAIQAGGRARVRTGDVIIVNPPVPGSGRDEGVEGPKAFSS
jgi:hypothetical protein